MGLQWHYPSGVAHWNALNNLRWSPSPPALDVPNAAWSALTEPAFVGEVDLLHFAPRVWDVALQVAIPGQVDAIVYWFELDLGGIHISNAPDSDLQCIKPAVQYVDSTPVRLGLPLYVRINVHETRLHFDLVPASTQVRAGQLADWQLPMLLDRRRNEAYGRSIARAMAAKANQTVLELGAGCGLLSILAAQAGARRVTACESDSFLAAAGNSIIASSDLADRIRLLNEDSRSLTVPHKLSDRADLLLFDLFDCSLIGAGILHFLKHARAELLQPDARYLPQAATLRAAVIEHRFDQIWGIDVKLLNPYRHSSTSFVNVDADQLKYRWLSEPVDVFAFDFATATPVPQEVELRLPIIASGAAGAILFWFDVQLDAESCLSNRPGSGSSLHWRQGIQFLQEAQVDTSMTLPLVARHDGSSLTFKWQPGAVQAEHFSRIPVFDPRVVASAIALDRQTLEIHHHCRQNPTMCADVAELALRFAVDPALHDIDPGVARRFAKTFLGSSNI